MRDRKRGSDELISEPRERYAVIIVTHDMQQAARISRRAAYFHRGTRS